MRATQRAPSGTKVFSFLTYVRPSLATRISNWSRRPCGQRQDGSCRPSQQAASRSSERRRGYERHLYSRRCRVSDSRGGSPAERVRGVETGGCPHAAIREDCSMNLEAIADLERALGHVDVVFIESGGDNLAAAFWPDLADTFDLCDRCIRRRQDPPKGGDRLLCGPTCW